MTLRRDRPLPAPLGALLRPATEGRPAFVEGLLIGAMVGAAIAGSTVWRRWHQRQAADVVPSDEPATETAAPAIDRL
ncbi:MAG: hypothetical protein HY263_00655 [Chloroflexi bacterium]|nr:hypothetical protein [Chloroflexota bacterium]